MKAFCGNTISFIDVPSHGLQLYIKNFSPAVKGSINVENTAKLLHFCEQ